MTLKFRTPLPRQSFLLGRLLHPLHRFFDWLYHSRFNPLYRSGTLAVGFLVVLLVTGLYLVFFYSISAPYESVTAIQAQWYAGRWIRAVHRYATDGAVLATAFHILQLLVQGKTWGPRTLAWLSGILLVGALFVSAWTGYVLVWDQHGQLLAMGGAEMLRLIPFLRPVVSAAFDGTNPVTPSFFFMNLFLHLALPIGLIFGLWVHTAKISRSRWFPIRPIFFWSVLAFVALGIVWPAVLTPKADLFEMLGTVPTDLIVAFWLPLASVSPLAAISLIVTMLVLLALMPWIWRPSGDLVRGASVVDPELCTGCTQCARDCPYEAIVMTPRDDGRRLLAEVRPESCVSCGICAASCGDVCVGPPERSGREQLEQVEEFCRVEFPQPSPEEVTIITCKHNGRVPKQWQEFAETRSGIHLYFADCCGTVHTQVMERLMQDCGGIFIHACPERNCFNRDGLELLTQRLFYKRVPFLSREIDRRRLEVDASSEQEVEEAMRRAESFNQYIANNFSTERDGQTAGIGRLQMIRAVAATICILSLIALLNQFPIGDKADSAVIRFGAKLPAQSAEECRPLSEADKQQLPLHMQLPQICQKRSLSYVLEMFVDRERVLNKTLETSNIRGDGMIFASEEAAVSAGDHEIVVLLGSREPAGTRSMIEFRRRVSTRAGRIYLVQYQSGTQTLELHGDS